MVRAEFGWYASTLVLHMACFGSKSWFLCTKVIGIAREVGKLILLIICKIFVKKCELSFYLLLK